MNTNLPHIVVLGAGFGGLTFAKDFPSERARITIVDRQNHHLFQPLLYQVATAGLAAPDIAQPIRSILRKKPNLTVLLADVTGIDLAARQVKLADGGLDYDYLVIALGSQTSYFGKNEWEQFAPGLKTLDDAMRLRRNMLLAYEKAEREPDAQKRQALMTTVVVGGGPTGVELAGTFAELARTVLYRDFDNIDPRQAHIILIEGSPHLLGAFGAKLSASAKQQIEQLGVEVRLNTRVSAIREGEVDVNGETIRAGNIVWAAGVAAVPVAKSLGVELDRAGRVKVLPDFSVPGQPRVFAIGDIASLTDAKGVVVPGVAQGGIQAGAHVARIIAEELKIGPTAPALRPAFAYHDKGNMATIGRTHAIAQIGKLSLTGLSAWLAWLALHLFFLVGFRNRISVLISWTYSYFTYQRGARIIMGLSDGQPPAK
ncbi:MAG: NAD(P)/FAD-dependent oxidoreductase [Lacunisphaera sp.]